jgi:NAD-specific glutamate dehydrogenase
MIKVCDYEKYIRKYQEELEREELEHDRQQLREFIFNKEIKEQFKKNIDELHNKFYDNFDENIPFDQQRIIRKFVDFLKQNV